MASGKSKKERFAARYSGEGATAYEHIRRDAKWDREEKAFDELYSLVRPKSVLDCPVGTGRFIDRYVRDGVRALGADLSPDMLAEAARKIPPGADIRLLRADILEPNVSSALGRDHDLIVCVRFVYALPRDDLTTLFRNFAATGARHLLVGVRMWAEGGGLLRPALSRIWNAEKRRPRWPLGRRRYVPKERRLIDIFAAAGWEVVQRREITAEADAFGRYFFLLRRRSASSA
jgi:hypothetical protein